MHRKNSDRLMLVKGIKSIISSSRCSFSEQELKVLNDCITYLQKLEDVPDTPFWVSKEFEQIAKLLIRIVASDEIKDIFDNWIN
jgi:negative regulator of replication initiation